MKTYIKHSDTCACVYIQTYDPDTETWGSLEEYAKPGSSGVEPAHRVWVEYDVVTGERYEVTEDPGDPEAETYIVPKRRWSIPAQQFRTRRCGVHRLIPFEDLNTVLIDECRTRNLTVKSLMENEQLAGPPVDWESLTEKEAQAERERLSSIVVDLMECCTYEGDGESRKAVFEVPLTRAETEDEYAKLETKAADEKEAITDAYVRRVEFR